MEETTDDLEMMEVGSSGAWEQQQQQRTDGANWSTENLREGKWTARRRTVRVSEERSRDTKREAEGQVTLEE